jgi:prefoldin subunit 5
LRRKIQEYQQLKEDIEALRREAFLIENLSAEVSKVVVRGSVDG